MKDTLWEWFRKEQCPAASLGWGETAAIIPLKLSPSFARASLGEARHICEQLALGGSAWAEARWTRSPPEVPPSLNPSVSLEFRAFLLFPPKVSSSQLGCFHVRAAVPSVGYSGKEEYEYRELQMLCANNKVMCSQFYTMEDSLL